MSFFDQQVNSYFAELGFTREFVVTPMVADILGMSLLYGLSTTTRAGTRPTASTRTRAATSTTPRFSRA